MTARKDGGFRLLAAGTIVVAAFAAGLPWLGWSTYAITLVYYASYYLALGQAWNLMSGLTGYVSFAHGALAGIGAYTAVIALNLEWPVAASLAAAAGVTALVSLLISATSLRLRGTAFTFATLFFQELVLLVVRKVPFTGGAGGLVLQEIFPAWLPHVLMIGTAAGATLAVLVFRRTRTGIRVAALRDDETAAGAVGIGATRLKTALFCASAAIAGLTGGVHAIFASSIFPNVVFAIDISIVALAVPLIGGAGTAMGPVVGALLYVGLRELLQVALPNLHVVVLGVVLLVSVLFLRNGIVGALATRLAAARKVGRS